MKGEVILLRQVSVMAGFFSSENWYWQPFAHVADAVILSCMWSLCSVPLLTAGAATTALYDTVAHCVRGSEKDMFSRFFGTMKRELVPSLICSLIWAGILFLAYQGIRLTAGVLPANNLSVLIVSGLFFILSLVVGIFSWVLPLLSRFTFPVGPLNLTAVKLACGHPFRTIASGIFTVLCFSLCLKTAFAFMILPEILAVIWAFLMEPVFKLYMTEEEREAVEKDKDDEDDL